MNTHPPATTHPVTQAPVAERENGARFNTITGDDWKRSLQRARVRRGGAKARWQAAVRGAAR